MWKLHRRVLVVLLVLLLGAAVMWVPGGFASPAQRPAAAHLAAAAASFALDPALTKVTNPNAAELTITPTAGGQAIDDHTGANGGAGNGGDWKVEYHWAVPPELVPGKTAAIYLQIIVDSENPPQPNGYQMGALAPNFAQSLPCHYPEQSSCSKTFEYPFLADEAGASEIVVSVRMLSAEVDFHYRPVSSPAPPPVVPPPPVVVPTPSGFDQTVTAPEPPPGGTAIITSPTLALAGAVVAPSAVTVDVSGLSVRDQVILAQRHACYVKFTKRLFNVLKGLKANQLADAMNSESGFQYLADFAVRYLTAELAACVAFVDAAEQRFQAQAAAAIAQASCAVTPLSLSISRSGAKARLRSVHLGSPTDPNQPLSVSCTPHSGKLTISVATRSKHTPLSRIVGSRLQIGIVRSPKDSRGGQLSVAFHRH